MKFKIKDFEKEINSDLHCMVHRYKLDEIEADEEVEYKLTIETSNGFDFSFVGTVQCSPMNVAIEVHSLVVKYSITDIVESDLVLSPKD